jgi:hypothetical protein
MTVTVNGGDIHMEVLPNIGAVPEIIPDGLNTHGDGNMPLQDLVPVPPVASRVKVP